MVPQLLWLPVTGGHKPQGLLMALEPHFQPRALPPSVYPCPLCALQPSSCEQAPLLHLLVFTFRAGNFLQDIAEGRSNPAAG